MGDVPEKRSAEEWRARLSEDAFHVLVERGTERCARAHSFFVLLARFRACSMADAAASVSSGSSPLDHEARPGVFGCGACGAPVFDAAAKFDSGTGAECGMWLRDAAPLSSRLTWRPQGGPPFSRRCRARWCKPSSRSTAWATLARASAAARGACVHREGRSPVQAVLALRALR